MNKFVLVCLAIAISTPPGGTLAGGKKTSSPARPTPIIDTNDKITALSLTSIIVTVYATHRSKEYKVTPATKIMVNGQTKTLPDLAAGMDVSVATLPNDSTTAATVDAKIPTRW
jgi:hypothetical protein